MLPPGNRTQIRLRPLGTLAILGIGVLSSACAMNGDLTIGRNNVLAESAAETAKADATSNLSEMDKAIVYWGKKAAEDPKDRKAVLSYARNLKAAGRSQQALAVLQQASFYHGSDREFAGEYGRLALSLGQATLAERLLKAADDPANPDWKIISGIGTAVAKQGRYTDAIVHYERALKVAPNQSSLLNNLAMAYAASGRAAEAEPLLRQAAAAPDASEMVHKNLALVLDLQGKNKAPPAAMATAPTTPAGLRGSTTPAAVSSAGWTTRLAKID